MRARSIVALALCVFSSAVLAQQPATLTDAQVAAAIKAGESKKAKDYVSSCAATAGFGAFVVAGKGVQPLGSISLAASTNFGRIAMMAENGKRLYKPLRLEDVDADLRGTPLVFVHAEPDDPDRNDGRIDVAPPIEHIVLKSKVDESRVLQPIDLSMEPVEWKNLVGGSVTSNRATATFSLAEFMALPAGDIDIVIVTPHGERRCKIGAGDQKKIFGR